MLIRELLPRLEEPRPRGHVPGRQLQGGLHPGRHDEPPVLHVHGAGRAGRGVRALLPGRLPLYNNFLEGKKLLVSIGVFKATAEGTGPRPTTAATGSPRASSPPSSRTRTTHRVLQIGVDFVYAGTPSGTQQYRARPDIGTGARFVDTGAVAADERDALRLRGPVHVEEAPRAGRVHLGPAGRRRRARADVRGFYVEVAYWITGGRPNWNKDKKTLDRPVIETNCTPARPATARGRSASATTRSTCPTPASPAASRTPSPSGSTGGGTRTWSSSSTSSGRTSPTAGPFGDGQHHRLRHPTSRSTSSESRPRRGRHVGEASLSGARG